MSNESNDDDDSEDSIEDIVDQMDIGGSSLFSDPFSMMSFGTDVDHEYSDGLKLGIKMMKAGQTMQEFAEFAEQSDVDFGDLQQDDMVEIDEHEVYVLYGFLSMAYGMNRMGETISPDDDDDDNPFKVSDGDDPVY